VYSKCQRLSCVGCNDGEGRLCYIRINQRLALHLSVCAGVFMSQWFANTTSPSHYVAAKFRQGLPHLISRGAKIEKVTNTHVLIQDIDEWLWQDAQTLDRLCKYQLINNIYSSVSTAPDGLNGIVVSINIVKNNPLWTLWQSCLSVVTCVVFFMWLKYVYLSGIVDV